MALVHNRIWPRTVIKLVVFSRLPGRKEIAGSLEVLIMTGEGGKTQRAFRSTTLHPSCATRDADKGKEAPAPGCKLRAAGVTKELVSAHGSLLLAFSRPFHQSPSVLYSSAFHLQPMCQVLANDRKTSRDASVALRDSTWGPGLQNVQMQYLKSTAGQTLSGQSAEEFKSQSTQVGCRLAPSLCTEAPVMPRSPPCHLCHHRMLPAHKDAGRPLVPVGKTDAITSITATWQEPVQKTWNIFQIRKSGLIQTPLVGIFH